MALFRKSDDPWDMDPGRQKKRPEREPMENPLDTLRAWNEKRKADADARQAELEALPREKCPWCGKEMERGYILCGKGNIWWYPGFRTARDAWIGPRGETFRRRLQVDNEGGLDTFQTAWICQTCQKMVLDTSKMYRPDSPAWPASGEDAAEDEASPEDGGEGSL